MLTKKIRDMQPGEVTTDHSVESPLLVNSVMVMVEDYIKREKLDVIMCHVGVNVELMIVESRHNQPSG